MAKLTKAQLEEKLKEAEEKIKQLKEVNKSLQSDISHVANQLHAARIENRKISEGDFSRTTVQPFKAAQVKQILRPLADKAKAAHAEYLKSNPLIRKRFFSEAPKTVHLMIKIIETIKDIERQLADENKQNTTESKESE